MIKQTLENIKLFLGQDCVTDETVFHNDKSYSIYKSFHESLYCVTSNDGLMGPVTTDKDDILTWINNQ